MRVFLHTFGCKANQYDTETVRQAIEDAGGRVVDDPVHADAAVVNSCTVTHVAEAKMRGMVRRIARARPGARTVVMGCAAALDDGTIAGLPGVTRVIAGSDPEAVLRALDLPVSSLDPVLRSFAREGRGWLRIQDGCDEHCTFCATTLARGASRSRPVAELVEEATALAERHAELVLTGIHIGTYGVDLGGETLGALLERLTREVPRVRFRLSSVEATEVDDRLADLMIGAPRHLASHLHAPLQSGSDRVLKRMGRHWYTRETYRRRVDYLVERMPVFGLGADVMVGFPGETDSDHRATVDLVKDLPFTYLHVFPYSERPGTAAGRLGRPVDPSVTADRSAELRELARAKGETHATHRQGQKADVVITGRAQGSHQGVTEDYLDLQLSSETPVSGRFDAILEFAAGRLTAVIGNRSSGMAPGPRATADSRLPVVSHA